jgi:hypothetical protein
MMRMIDPRELTRSLEELGVLNGTRGSDPSQKAVRLAEMIALLEFPPAPGSRKAAGAAPTKAEHDALVEDVHLVFRQLAALSEALRVRLAP